MSNFLSENYLALISLAVSISALIFAQRGNDERNKMAAIKLVVDVAAAKLNEEIAYLKEMAEVKLKEEISNLVRVGGIKEETVEYEAEILKLQKGLDKCVKDRIIFKGEISTIKEALRMANIQVKGLQDEDPGTD